MPISDCEGYCLGHFSHVYEYIIKPACLKAGFEPVRADEVRTTNVIALDVVKRVINSDMCLCDLSGQNPNVLYELGIRQAFNRPVTIIKDDVTKRIFDIQGIRDVEYDHALRVDHVRASVEEVAEMLTNTYEKVDEVNSLVKLLGVEAARVSDKTTISVDTELILSAINGLEKRVVAVERAAKAKEMPLSLLRPARDITEIPDGVGEKLREEEIEQLPVGEEVFHSRYGMGTVLKVAAIKGQPITVDFGENGVRQLAPKWAPLRRVHNDVGGSRD